MKQEMVNFATWVHLPESTGDWQAFRAPSTKIILGETRVRRALHKWHALDPILVATPNTTQYLPPVCLPDIGEQVHQEMAQRQRTVLGMMGVMALVSFIVYLLSGGREIFAPVAAAFIVLFLYLVVEYMLVLKNRECTIERSLLVCYCYQKSGKFVLGAVIVMLMAGAVQWRMQNVLGGLEPLVDHIGVLFSATENGEWWRYLIGPFIHAGLLHWISNAVMLVVAAGLAGAMGRKGTLTLLFLVMSVASTLVTEAAEHLVVGHQHDSLLGVSGAIYGLFGWVIGVLFQRRQIFSNRWWFSVLWFVMLNLALGCVLIKQASNVAHASGLLIGVTLGLLGIGVSPEWSGMLPKKTTKSSCRIESIDAFDSKKFGLVTERVSTTGQDE